MSRRIAVAYLNNFAGPTLGGGEVQLLTLLKGLAETGSVDATVVCPEGSSLAREAAVLDGVRMLTASFSPRSLPGVAWRLAAAVGSPDIVQGTGYLTNLVARRVGRRSGAAVVNAVHVVPGASLADGGSRLGAAARGLVDRGTRSHVDRFVAVSGAVEHALTGAGVDPSRITIVPNGIDADAVRREAANGARVALPDTYTGPLIGFVGRLEPVKGPDVFVRMATLVAEQRPDAGFVLAGSGSQLQALRRQAESLGLAERLFIPGAVASIPPLLRRLSVLVMPSRSEAFGLVAAEALALEVPVVAARVGGLTDLVVDSVTGLLADADDPHAFAAAALELLDDRERALGMARAGRARVDAEFTATRMVDGYLKVYRELADARA